MYAELLPLDEPPGLSKALSAEFAGLANDADELAQLEQEITAADKGALCDLRNKTTDEHRRLKDWLIDRQYEATCRFLDGLDRRVELSEGTLEAMIDDRPKRVDALEAMRKKTAKKLRDSGFKPEDHPMYHANPKAIERQFEVTVEQSSEVRKLRESLADWDGRIEYFRDQIRRHDEHSRKAEIDLENLARQILGMRRPEIITTPPRRHVSQLSV